MTDSAPSAPLLIAPPPPGWQAGRARSDSSSGMATASLVLGIVALVLNVLFIPTVLAIVFGAISLARGSRRTRAIVGIVLGALGIITSAAIAIPVFLGAQQAARASAVASMIQNDAANRGVSYTDVRCPAPRAVQPGAVLVCTGQGADGAAVRFDVTFTSAGGAFTYRAARA